MAKKKAFRIDVNVVLTTYRTHAAYRSEKWQIFTIEELMVRRLGEIHQKFIATDLSFLSMVCWTSRHVQAARQFICVEIMLKELRKIVPVPHKNHAS